MSRRVLITGASRGIGRAIAFELAGCGFDLALNYVANVAAAEECMRDVEALGARAQLLAFDIANRDQCRERLEQNLQDHGPFYGVVCNAGVCDDAPFPALSTAAWDKVLHTNLDGFYNVLQPLVMPMIQMRGGGRIVTLSSVSGLVGNRGQVNYCASKAGIVGATKALAQELAKRQITVNCVAPGIIATDMTSRLALGEVLQRIPLRRLGRPDEVAAAVGFLFSERAGYITGQVLSVNGGLA
jgi:3-oxoacyl-[acyl-carrier protein] reductase